MISNQSRNPQPEGRIELLLIVGVVICIAGNLLLSVGQRMMDRVAVNVAGPTAGLEFWENLPADVRELDRQIERQAALLEPILKFHANDLVLPDDGTRTEEEQRRIDERVEAALAEPTKALRVIQAARAARIKELKAEYLKRRANV
jgi:hypothetical protein